MIVKKQDINKHALSSRITLTTDKSYKYLNIMKFTHFPSSLFVTPSNTTESCNLGLRYAATSAQKGKYM